MAGCPEFGSAEFHRAVETATRDAFDEALAAGLPVFCRDDEGLNIVQYQDGRRFEIRWIQGGPIGRNYEILRELKSYAA